MNRHLSSFYDQLILARHASARTALLGVIALTAASPVLVAQNTPPSNAPTAKRTIKIQRIETSITIDGQLDESPWRTTAPIGDLLQR